MVSVKTPEVPLHKTVDRVVRVCLDTDKRREYENLRHQPFVTSACSEPEVVFGSGPFTHLRSSEVKCT